MNIRTVVLILVLIPVVVVGGIALAHFPMNAAVGAVLGWGMIYLAHTLLSLFVFIFFYLWRTGGAFVGIVAGILDPRADVPFGILMLAVMGLLAGQMLYRWKMDLILVTAVAVLVTLGSMAIGARGLSSQKGTTPDGKAATALVYNGPVNSLVAGLDNAINSLSRGASP